ncbi:LRR receptor-like serine/threonine-protein kinase ERECTA isoform X1 [Eucalyptus grandis]|uniref:LRR receptor-like serine/threonine-protein kinase ERECTA isoform X1 n=1 Tax=Eucalyptus grandis TaxID=71139 RepID=UPI00192EE9A9|nr:LRR receptor-like serine/threonine-protein kinase ERECTA isoform X1 [Eucalyptus grandis]
MGPSPFFAEARDMAKLNLSRNHLTGFIPAEFGNLRSIMDMRLDHNNLSGDVISLMNSPSLTILNVSYNNLVGEIPMNDNSSRFSQDSFVGNPRLCGYWLNSPCGNSHLTERVTISKAAILGIALGALVILLMILVAACRPQNSNPFVDGSFGKPAVYYSPPKLVILHMNMARPTCLRGYHEDD